MTSLAWIESEPPQPPRTVAPPLDLVGPGEIAQRLGKKRATVAAWRSRGLLPEPLAYLADGTEGRSIKGRRPSPGLPVWQWSMIREWAEATDRI